MKTQSGLFYGNVRSDVQEVLGRLYQRLPTFRSALIRCLDSIHTPAELLAALVRYRIDARLEPSGVVVSKKEVLRAANERRVFVGFDEVWMFEHDSPGTVACARYVLTSDAVNFNERLPDGLEACMGQTRCVLALGDGCGLNYATWDEGLAGAINAISDADETDLETGDSRDPKRFWDSGDTTRS